MEYSEFIKERGKIKHQHGTEVNESELNPMLYPFQKDTE